MLHQMKDRPPMTAGRALVLPVLAAIAAALALTRGCGADRSAPVRSGLTTTAPASSASTAVSEPEGASTATALARRWPILARLPHEAPAWRIDYRVEGDRLVLWVRLRALRLRDPGAESYQSQLRRYKSEVLAWLGPGLWTIEWDPAEAATL